MENLKDEVVRCNFDKVEELLNNGVEWDLPDFLTENTLGNLFRQKRFNLLKTLVDNEVVSLDIFEYDKFRRTIFQHIIDAPFSDELQQFLEAILPKVENIDDELSGDTWLGLAIKKNSNSKIIELLMNAGCAPNKINTKEETYLFSTQDIALTQVLLDNGVDINKKNLIGRTAFYAVVASKDAELIQLYLDNGIDVNSPDNKGETVYNVVCFNIMDGVPVFEQLASFDPPQVNLKDSDGESIFMKMSRMVEWESHIQIFGMMIDHGADLFHEALDIYGNPTTASDLVAKKSVQVLEMLSNKGYLDVKAIDARGNTWLHKVCKEELNFEQKKAKELYKKVKFLLKNGAHPKVKNDEDKSPIDYAQEDNLKVKALQIMLK